MTGKSDGRTSVSLLPGGSLLLLERRWSRNAARSCPRSRAPSRVCAANNTRLFDWEAVGQSSEYRMRTGQHAEVQEQCKQHMPTGGGAEL